MMRTTGDILLQDTTSQSEALAAGRYTSESLTQLTLDAINAKNEQLNCYLYTDAAAALAAAKASDKRRAKGAVFSAIDGLCIAVKDNIDVANMPTTAGLGTVLRTPISDAPVISALRAAGAIIIGKLNMDEAAVGTGNNNPHHGQCHNPNKPGYVPGGSSGGSACAVAAGLCSMALGTDTMGSIRIPAACCGVVGFKPSYGSISNKGSVACARNMDHIGPITRSIRDLNLWLPVLNNHEPKQPIDFDKLNIAIPTLTSDSVHCDEFIKQQFKKFVTDLNNQVPLSKVSIATNSSQLRLSGLIAVELDIADELNSLLKSMPSAVSPALTKMLQWVAKQSPEKIATALSYLEEAKEKLLNEFGTVDIIILPTLTQPIPTVDEPSPAGFADLTALANVAGIPAISIPVNQDFSVQLFGQTHCDRQLVAAAQRIAELA